MEFDWGTLKGMFDAAGGLKSLSEALDIGKKVRDLLKSSGPKQTETERQLRELAVDLQEKLIDAREQSVLIRAQLLHLVQERDREAKFDAERKYYERVELARNSFFYRRRRTAEAADDRALYCCHCFEQDQRIVTLVMKDFAHVRCTVCDRVYYSDDRDASDGGTVIARSDYDVFKI